MQTCQIFTQWTGWLTREVEKVDPDLLGTTKPRTMTTDQWNRFQATKTGSSSGGPRPASHDASTLSADGSDPEAKMANLNELIKKWESNFSRHLQILLDALNHYAATETVVLLSLCARLSTANQGTEYAGIRNEDDAA